jgi:phosphoribosyl 1,2-cyclic phosphodiesterase
MTVCSTTGITVPECSCQDCLTALIERHSPSLLEANTAVTPPTLEMPAVTRIPRARFARLRRLRKAA